MGPASEDVPSFTAPPVSDRLRARVEARIDRMIERFTDESGRGIEKLEKRLTRRFGADAGMFFKESGIDISGLKDFVTEQIHYKRWSNNGTLAHLHTNLG